MGDEQSGSDGPAGPGEQVAVGPEEPYTFRDFVQTPRNLIGMLLLVSLVFGGIVFVRNARKTAPDVPCADVRRSELTESQDHLIAELDTRSLGSDPI